MSKRGKKLQSIVLWPEPPPRPKRPLPRMTRGRSRTPDSLYNRPAEPGSAEYEYLHRYDSPDNRRDTMG